VKKHLSEKLLVPQEDLVFIVKQGCSWRVQSNLDEVRYEVRVKGIDSFEPKPMVWPHPIGIIGQGYHGMKTAMRYLKDGNTNIICFDRNNRVGGYCWITGANETSKLQTEFAAFHVWYGPDFAVEDGKCGDGFSDLQKWSAWPKKAEILEHFQYAADQWGLDAYAHFRSNVGSLNVIGAPEAEERYYELSVESLDRPGEVKKVPVSVIYNFPGSLTTNRIVDYPGEDTFDGDIRYGMNDDICYDRLPGRNVAILGNGAFAIENARTCIEASAGKVYLITRRKNLASPRMPCWFVHQAPIALPGHMVLTMFEPMYNLCGFGDPWGFWSVHANKDRTNVSIIQSSRFGIGDITFLAVAWGRLVYVEDTLKRCTRHTLHLSSGRKLEEVQIILKALGLLGDWSVDKLHKMKEVVGNFCAGDFRRVFMIDATGMNAANFETFSTGIGTWMFSTQMKYLHDFPQEVYKAQSEHQLLEALPKHKAEPELEKPAYLTDVRHSMNAAIMLGMLIPKVTRLPGMEAVPGYWYRLYHAGQSWERTYSQCVEEWNAYQKKWREEGWEHAHTPYPYTRDIMEGYMQQYNALPNIASLGISISLEGPPKP